MLRLAADENFDGRITRGIRRSAEDLDLVRIQDTALTGASDEAILDWAASEGRIILTHDMSTLIGLAYARLESGLPMAGVITVTPQAQIGTAIEDILLLRQTMSSQEMAGQVVYVPLSS